MVLLPTPHFGEIKGNVKELRALRGKPVIVGQCGRTPEHESTITRVGRLLGKESLVIETQSKSSRSPDAMHSVPDKTRTRCKKRYTFPGLTLKKT